MTKKKKKQVEEEVEIDWSDDEDDQLPALINDFDGIELPSAWGQTATSVDEVRKAMQSMNLKHGMFANVPMVCKGGQCPMHAICTISLRHRPVLKRCPIEIAAIIDRYDKYLENLGVGPEDYMDQSQIKDLVDTEIKLMRASGHLAISADFIEEVVTAIDDKGNAHYRPELHKATEYEEKLLARKSKLLSDLNASRKARKADGNLSDPSSFASDLMRRAMKAQKNIIDITPVDDDDYVEEGE